MNKEFENYLEMATAYLAKKEQKNYYEFTAFDEEINGRFFYLNELSDEEVKQIENLKTCYGDDYIKYLDKVFDDPDVISDLTVGDEILEIDTESKYHKYEFVLHEVYDGQVTTKKLLLCISDDSYAKLLAWHLYDHHLTINTLYCHDKELYDLITCEAMRNCCDEIGCCFIDNPFVLTMDEAVEDVESIMKEHGLHKGDGYLPLFF